MSSWSYYRVLTSTVIHRFTFKKDDVTMKIFCNNGELQPEIFNSKPLFNHTHINYFHFNLRWCYFFLSKVICFSWTLPFLSCIHSLLLPWAIPSPALSSLFLVLEYILSYCNAALTLKYWGKSLFSIRILLRGVPIILKKSPQFPWAHPKVDHVLLYFEIFVSCTWLHSLRQIYFTICLLPSLYL